MSYFDLITHTKICIKLTWMSISGAIPLIPPYVFMSWTGKTSPFTAC